VTTVPTIRLEIEGMKHSVLHRLAVHHGELEEAVDAEVTRALEAFDAAAVARNELANLLPDIVRELVNDTIRQVVWSPEVRDALREATTVALVKALTGEVEG